MDKSDEAKCQQLACSLIDKFVGHDLDEIIVAVAVAMRSTVEGFGLPIDELPSVIDDIAQAASSLEIAGQH